MLLASDSYHCLSDSLFSLSAKSWELPKSRHYSPSDVVMYRRSVYVSGYETFELSGGGVMCSIS